MVVALFRCDSSFEIGSGHVYRSRSLARTLASRGIDIVFICRPQPGDLISLLRSEFEVWLLPPLHPNDTDDDSFRSSSSTNLNDKNSWLGCSQITDAHQTLDLIRLNSPANPQWLVVDHYGIDTVWESLIIDSMKNELNYSYFRLAVIDDLMNRFHASDLLLDQNITRYFQSNPYEEYVPPYCKSLLGPRYTLLGSEYSILSACAITRNSVNRILVFFGGSDVHDCTSVVLRALSDPLFANIAVDVVLGKSSPNYSSVSSIVRSCNNFNLFESLPSLAFLIARADLAIGAIGSTSWERIALKLYTLGVSIAPNQLSVANQLHQLGFIEYLGAHEILSEEVITKSVCKYLSNPTFLTTNFEADGYGTHRVAAALFGPLQNYSLRSVIASDVELLFHWANDPDVRGSSINKKPITWEDHCKWFYNGLHNPNRLHLLLEDSSHCPIGQVRFDRHTDSLCVVISFSIDSVFRGYGVSEKMLRLAFYKLSSHWSDDLVLVADVYPANKASMAIFSKLGFTLSEEPNSNATVRWSLSSPFV